MAESKDNGLQWNGRARPRFSGELEETSYKVDRLRTSKETLEDRSIVSDLPHVISDKKEVIRDNGTKVSSNGEAKKQRILTGESKSNNSRRNNSDEKQIDSLREAQYLDIDSDSKNSSDTEEIENKYAVGMATITDDDFTPEIDIQNFSRGFRINSMNMKDGLSGRQIWSTSWESLIDTKDMFGDEIRENIPMEILDCRIVSREVIFTSAMKVNDFRLVQKIFFNGQCIEEWRFHFGFVIPGSTNSWQQTIEAAPKNQMIPAAVLSGNLVFETSFFDNETFLCKNTVRIFYV